MLSVGDRAPDFELPDQDGSSVRLSDFRGRPVVVYFYPRADTPGCTTEACGYRDAFDGFEAADAIVLGVSDDPVEDIAAFAEKYELPFRLLSDPDGEVAAMYDSYGEKQMFGRTFDGVYRNTYVIDPEGRVAAAYESVSPDGHAEAVLEDLPAD
jgi:peroxiredoxin Q/BCP